MPYIAKNDTGEILKKYYSVGEAAIRCNVPTCSLRFWDEVDEEWPKFIGPVKRDTKGNRQYTKNQLDKLQLIAEWSKTPRQSRFELWLRFKDFMQGEFFFNEDGDPEFRQVDGGRWIYQKAE